MDSQEGSHYVRVDRRGSVAVISLDHPQDRNALSLAMSRALAAAVHRVAAEGAIGAIVLAATGSAFSSGGSVDDLLEPKAPLSETYVGFVALLESELPTVAAVSGPALGAGMNLAMACDVVVCSPSARFETRFLDVGLHPGGGHLWQLRQRIGRQGAAALSLFGETLDGEEAARRQLAWRCVPEIDLLETAWQLASRAAGHDRALVRKIPQDARHKGVRPWHTQRTQSHSTSLDRSSGPWDALSSLMHSVDCVPSSDGATERTQRRRNLSDH